MSIKKLGFNFKDVLRSRDRIHLTSKELSVLTICCETKEENILEKLVKSKDKEECMALALLLNIGKELERLIDDELLTRSVIENHEFKVELNIEQCEFLLDAIELYIDDIKLSFKGIEDDNFDAFCLKLAEIKSLEDKIHSFVNTLSETIKIDAIIEEGEAVV